jgi:acyl-coenzyme A synthetase/AMP-(fatty) acid ligase
MMREPSFPLVSSSDLDAIFAWRQGKPISVRDYLCDVHSLAAAMPASRHVLNTCHDRYHFSVGFGAALVRGMVSLMPSTRTPDTVAQLRAFAPDLFSLSETPCDLDLPHMPYPEMRSMQTSSQAPEMPMIAADQLAAQVFTSGSTGAPTPHRKTWGALVHCMRASAARLGMTHHPSGRLSLIGTVPPQHMYGFESTLLLALQGGVALGAAHPFYPADVAAALASLPAPRLLVSTPVHLRALLAADVNLPPLAAVLSATAPLAAELALELEARLGAPLLEIYGSTETGQIACRRTSRTDVWELFPDVRLRTDATGSTLAQGGHLADPVPISDVIASLDASHFRLLGRSADMVNIAGKRSSLAHLNHQLGAIPGVRDGAFFMPDTQGSGVTRLMAFAVAPGLRKAALLAQLRLRIDSAFLPRPLVLLDALPRNATGKLTHASLVALATSQTHLCEVETEDD